MSEGAFTTRGVTLRIWNYGDHHQQAKLAAGNVLSKLAGPEDYIYEIPRGTVRSDRTPLDAQLQQEIQSVSDAVVLNRYQALKRPRGKIAAYRV